MCSLLLRSVSEIDGYIFAANDCFEILEKMLISAGDVDEITKRFPKL